MQMHTSKAPAGAGVCRQTKTNRDVLAVLREKANYGGNSQSSGDQRASKTRLNGQDDLTWDMLRGWMPPTPYVNKAKDKYRSRHPGNRYQQQNVEDEGGEGTEMKADECRQRTGAQKTELWKQEMCGAIESSYLRAQAVMASAGLLPRWSTGRAGKREGGVGENVFAFTDTNVCKTLKCFWCFLDAMLGRLRAPLQKFKPWSHLHTEYYHSDTRYLTLRKLHLSSRTISIVHAIKSKYRHTHLFTGIFQIAHVSLV